MENHCRHIITKRHLNRALLPMARRQQPVPLLARRGQCTVMTTALLHSAWLNRDSAPRKGMHFAWAAAGVPIGLPAGQVRFFLLAMLSRLFILASIRILNWELGQESIMAVNRRT
jgi:hypothetical protein